MFLALETKQIEKHYQNKTALNKIDLHVPEESVYGLLGPNGAGKTTLIRIVNQIIAPDAGEVYFFGEKLTPKHIKEIGYLPEERGLYRKMRVDEHCLYLAQLKGMEKSDAKRSMISLFNRLGIDEFQKKKIEELSKGMAQKVQFVSTIIHQPRLIILDEPFSGFDPINTKLVLEEIELLKKQGCTVILSTHNMDSVEQICDNISLFHQGNKLLEGEVYPIQKEHSKQEFVVEFEGNMIAFTNALWIHFELLSHIRMDGQRIRAVVKAEKETTLNDLIKLVLPHVQIIKAEERLPSMKEVFIESIQSQEKSQEKQTESTL